MKHTTEELLLAAEVRRLAADRIKARLPLHSTDADRSQAFATEGTAVVAEVLNELGNIASLISALRARD